MHYPHTAIYGPSGHGKSHSIQGLDPSEVVVVNTECKQLPFREASQYQQIWVPQYHEFNDALIKATSGDHKVVVIDSFMAFSEILEDWCRRKYENDRNKYKPYDEYNRILWATLRHARKVQDKLIVWMGIDEFDEIDGISKIKLSGKKMRGAIEKEFVSVLYCRIQDSDSGKLYGFHTQASTGFIAKTPAGMFEDEYIPNNLKDVLVAAERYYSGSESLQSKGDGFTDQRVA